MIYIRIFQRCEGSGSISCKLFLKFSGVFFMVQILFQTYIYVGQGLIHIQ